jgi:copper homeostasis protein
MKRILEICCDHLDSALAAEAGGADRIELCVALSTDGLSPSAGLLATVRKQLRIPIFVLIRPRPGNFVYSDLELETMCFDIHQCKGLGADGIVSGALLENREIDLEATAKLVATARPLPFTFHKAFDLIPDASEGLDQLMSLGVDRVLTSGQAASALAGKSALQKLAKRGKGKIEILCGGGIRDHNLVDLLDSDLIAFHSSALSGRGASEQSIPPATYPTVDAGMVARMKQLMS